MPKEFEEVFRYRVIDGTVTDEKIVNEKLWRSRRVVYVRVCEERILYVGKSDGLLCRRMLRHVRGFLAVGKAIFEDYRKCVNGRTVSIFAYQPEPLRLFEFDLPIHVALEWAMIEQFKPPFVKRR
jgi:transposase-like protein